jgi:riboflavin kinase/FMN adenylyltransferase
VITTFERSKLTPPPEGSVVSIGVFDGVHRGHQAILEANVRAARELGAVPTVVTFRRHPKRLLLGRAPKTLTTLDHRLELFARAGIEHAVALTFDERIRELPPDEFAREVAADGLGVRRFVLGFDSRFGANRAGTPQLLRELGFDVDVVPQVAVQERAISSTAIREAVELGDLEGASMMLGRPLSVLGLVVHGANLGGKIGFPTANLDLHHELHPPPGVYACRALVLRSDAGDQRLDGVVNIGFRPTVHQEKDGLPALPTIEVHLFDFSGDLYGERIELQFEARLRGEKRFSGIDELTDQIGRDVERAKEILATAG